MLKYLSTIWMWNCEGWGTWLEVAPAKCPSGVVSAPASSPKSAKLRKEARLPRLLPGNRGKEMRMQRQRNASHGRWWRIKGKMDQSFVRCQIFVKGDGVMLVFSPLVNLRSMLFLFQRYSWRFCRWCITAQSLWESESLGSKRPTSSVPQYLS